jgi:hypothetical protein
MKHTITFVVTLFLLLLCGSTFAQSNYHYNQAKAFNEYVSEGTWTYKTTNKSDAEELELKKVSLNKKDLEGNDLFRFDFKFKDGQECSLVPDNNFYPMAYVLVRKQNNKNYFRGVNNQEFYYIALGSGLIARVSPSIGMPLEDGNQYTRILFEEYNSNYLDKRQKNAIANGSLIKNGGKGSPFANWVDFTKAEGYEFRYNPSASTKGGSYGYEYKGLTEFYTKMKEYQDGVLKTMKDKGYQKLFADFKDGEYYYYGKEYKVYPEPNYIIPGNVMLKFEKSKDKFTNLKIQNSFDDGKFYDKEKFYTNFPIRFSTESNVASLVPFEDKILVMSVYNGNFNSVMGVFSKYPYDITAIHIAKEWDNKFWLFQKTSEKYFCTTEFESSYDQSKDPYYFWTYMTKVYSALSGK